MAQTSHNIDINTLFSGSDPHNVDINTLFSGPDPMPGMLFLGAETTHSVDINMWLGDPVLTVAYIL